MQGLMFSAVIESAEENPAVRRVRKVALQSSCPLATARGWERGQSVTGLELEFGVRV